MIQQTAQRIPTGYKNSNIGVLPDDWDAKPLGDLGECLIGLTYKPEDVKEYGTLVLRSSNIFDGRLAFDDNVYVDLKVPERVKVRRGDILICVRNGSRDLIGKCALVDARVEGEAFGAFMSVFRSSHSSFIFYQFQSNLVQRQIRENIGATINQITNKHLNSFSIPFPIEVKERTSIASVLSDVDTLIASLEKLIAKKRAIKQGAMQELLTGKRRLLGFSGNWKKKKLGDILLLSATYSKTKFIDEGGNYLIMDMGSVSSGGQMIASKRTFLSADLLKIGDLVMPKDDIGGGNIIGKAAYINQDNKYVLGDHVYKLSAKTPETDTLFFSYLINGYAVNRELRKKVAGSAQLGLGRKSVEEQDVKIPEEKTEQTAIAKVLSDMDAEIIQLEQKLAKYRMLKQGMMQVLLMGKVRLV